MPPTLDKDMVMEKPSAHSVAREFVRQYYTLLHQAPNFLHRFYSTNSSFLHGGMEKAGQEQPAICGQEQIHNKIMALQYKECRAKIHLVDSQTTVGNSIVVQVSGELSNDGGNFRRFMQTFVLVEQEPRKYYVHNDIFRYQDEVFETENDPQNDSSEPIETVDHTEEQTAEPQEQINTYFNNKQTEQTTVLQPVVSNGPSDLKVNTKTEEINKEPAVVVEKPTSTKQEVEEQQSQSETASSSKPTWADACKVNKLSSNVSSQQTKIEPKSVDQQQQKVSHREKPLKTDQGENIRSNEVDGDSKPSTRRFQDVNQVFVGNLAHNTTEEELREFFTAFGVVEEVRIIQNNKKTKDDQDAPNYGFIVFTDPNAVQRVLEKRGSLSIRGDRRLNVEEKKARDGPKMTQLRPNRPPGPRKSMARGSNTNLRNADKPFPNRNNIRRQ